MIRSITEEKLTIATFLLFAASLPYNMKLANGLLVVILVIVLYKQIQVWKGFSDTPTALMLLLIGYYILEIVGLLYSRNIDYGLEMLERHIPLILFPLIFYFQRLSHELIFKILIAFILSCSIGCLICIIVNIERSLVYDKLFHEWMFSHDQFSDPIQMQAVYFSIYVAFSLLIILIYSISDFERKYQLPIWMKFTTTPILIISLILMGARTVTIITLMLALAVLFYTAFLKRAWIFGVIALATILLFSLFVSLHPVLRQRFYDLVTTDPKSIFYDSYNSRFRIWKPGLEVIKENFWLGVGTGDSQDALDMEYIKSDYKDGIGKHNMHNQYLQSFMDYGITGLVFILAILGFQLRVAIKHRSILYICFLILISFSMLTESVLNRNKGILFVVFFSLLLFPQKNLSNS